MVPSMLLLVRHALTRSSGSVQIALRACTTSMGNIREVHFMLNNGNVHEAFKRAADECIRMHTATLVKPDATAGPMHIPDAALSDVHPPVTVDMPSRRGSQLRPDSWRQ